MTPDQLKYLTDEERRAWEACLSTSAYAFGTMASVALPAALEALADARRERDEARALLLAADEELALTARAIYGVEADAHMLHESAAEVVRERDEARAALVNARSLLTPKYDRETDAVAGAVIAQIDAALTPTPGEDPAPHVAGAPDAAKGGALGVGLTNCDNCANDYLIDGRRMCRRVDALWANFRAEREAADELDEWVAGNTNEDGAPLPGATGCPGWAKRGEG